jgi:methyltransferase (TIGR00027 family)
MVLFGSGKARQAMSTATMRAVESYRDPGERLYDDRVAIALLPAVWQAFVRPLRFAVVRKPVLWYRDRQFPGVIGNVICRTRFIDDVVRRELQSGAAQVVVLGAGFDTRPYRIPELERVDVFEVDHPTVQELKERRLRSALGSVPDHVTLVPIDFDEQELLPSLQSGGFDVNERTAFVWEGVTQYITEDAIRSTLEVVSSCAEGSTVVFTYIDEAIVDGSERTAIDRQILAVADRSGSPWISGLDPDRLESFLADFGLSLVADVGAATYRERYLDPIDRDLDCYEGERTAVATIALEG